VRKVVLLAVLLTMFFIWLDRNNASKRAAVAAVNNKAQNQSPSPALQTTPRPVSEHDWAKRSLDRASEVADQVREKRQENEQP
jgi:hypothetical protein